MYDFMNNILLFRNIPSVAIPSLLKELGATKKEYKKGEILFHEGESLDKIGIVLQGLVLIESADVWGNNSLLGSASKGSVFGEAYACVPGEKLMISVRAVEASTVLFIDVDKILTGSNSDLVHNLLIVCAKKNLQLSRRILHTSSKSLRGRLMSFFSECVKKEDSLSFSIPLNRQQLADYLSVDRSAMCNELSKMQKDGLITYHKNQFTILAEL